MPNLGQIVFYHETYSIQGGLETAPAIIAKVGGETPDQFTLVVFDPQRGPLVKRKVREAQNAGSLTFTTAV